VNQVFQNLRSGETVLTEVPAPCPAPGAVLIQTRASLISAGTERMLIEFGKASLFSKARSQPEKVTQVLNKIQTDGLLPTLEAVFNRLDEPLPLGYCNAGVVLEVGAGVTDLKPGDRVASNGPHAEIVAVPRNLCAKVPETVSDEQAAFTLLSSIGLQGLRLLQPTLGESVVVFGLGLIGLVTVQLLRANGCNVMGIDVNPARLALAKRFGAVVVDGAEGRNPVAAATAWTGGKGADGVLITASAKEDTIVHQAAEMCRKRGRIVLVGVVDLRLKRGDFYEKELNFQVSCSYGPGRYDDNYEKRGQDYPYGLVRWTETRNFEAVLELMRSGLLAVNDLITHRYAIGDAAAAYQKVAADRSALGVILQYPRHLEAGRRVDLSAAAPVQAAGQTVAGVIGAGNFAKMMLMPALAKTMARVKYVCSLQGASAAHLARKFRGEIATTDYSILLEDSEVNAVIIAVGHHLHARLVCESLAAGKHVFVEKPLALTVEELAAVQSHFPLEHKQLLMVGFNRRFSPHSIRLKEILADRTEPLALTMTVNAGAIPPEHWVHDPERGGGRIIGEACHFIDLMVFLSGSLVSSVAANMMNGAVLIKDDKVSISLSFEDGSIGTINYFANGSKSYPKESIEVFSEGRVIRLENFRKTTAYGFRSFKRLKTWRQDKGHLREFGAFVDRVRLGGLPLIPRAELINVSLASFAAMTAAREGRIIAIGEEYGEYLAEGRQNCSKNSDALPPSRRVPVELAR
jgi:predicted dehydrogenase/threonine dehydrogenase-like Zn-dependent dehydrogenase